jgi:hypothetical protein
VEITYVLDASDLDALRKLQWARKPRAVWTIRGILLLLGLGYIGAVIAATFLMERASRGLLIVLTVIVALPLVALQVWYLLRKARKKAGRQLEERCHRVPWRMTLALDGLYVFIDRAQDFTRWSGILEIAQTPGHAFFLLRNEGQLLAYILPRRAFNSQQEFEAFLDQARRYRDDYREAAPAPGPGSAVLEYRLTVEDHEGFQAQVGKGKPPSTIAALVWLGLMGAAVTVLSLPALLQGQPPWLLILFVVVVALVLLAKWYYRRQLRKALRAVYAKGPHRLMLVSDGLHVLVGDSQVFLQWGAIRKIVETPERLFLMTGQGQGQIVPRHAFASAAEFADFVDLVWRHYERTDTPIDPTAKRAAPPDAGNSRAVQERRP